MSYRINCFRCSRTQVITEKALQLVESESCYTVRVKLMAVTCKVLILGQ